MIVDLNPVIRGWGNYYRMGTVQTLYRHLDGWIRMRLRSKVIGKKATTHWNRKIPNRVFEALGLVTLTSLRQSHLSPGSGRSLG
jgi:hypothetical protein